MNWLPGGKTEVRSGTDNRLSNKGDVNWLPGGKDRGRSGLWVRVETVWCSDGTAAQEGAGVSPTLSRKVYPSCPIRIKTAILGNCLDFSPQQKMHFPLNTPQEKNGAATGSCITTSNWLGLTRQLT